MSGKLEQTAETLCDTHDMVVVHRVFRREFRLLTGMISTVPAGDVVRAALVAGHATEMVAALHHHHSGEDELLWPRLQERVALPGVLLDVMVEQHEYIAGVLDHATELLPQWTRTADRDLSRQLAAHFDDVSAALDQHLLLEESDVLPAVEQHITAEEWAELGRRGMASIPNNPVARLPRLHPRGRQPRGAGALPGQGPHARPGRVPADRPAKVPPRTRRPP